MHHFNLRITGTRLRSICGEKRSPPGNSRIGGGTRKETALVVVSAAGVLLCCRCMVSTCRTCVRTTRCEFSYCFTDLNEENTQPNWTHVEKWLFKRTSGEYTYDPILHRLSIPRPRINPQWTKSAIEGRSAPPYANSACSIRDGVTTRIRIRCKARSRASFFKRGDSEANASSSGRSRYETGSRWCKHYRICKTRHILLTYVQNNFRWKC